MRSRTPSRRLAVMAAAALVAAVTVACGGGGGGSKPTSASVLSANQPTKSPIAVGVICPRTTASCNPSSPATK